MIVLNKDAVDVLVREYAYMLDLNLRLEHALSWCGGAHDFAEGAWAHEGWKKIALPLLEEMRERRKKLLHTLEQTP